MDEPIDFTRTMRMMKNPYALGFSLGSSLRRAAECAVYVWMPTLLTGYSGSFAFMATYAISVFFILRCSRPFSRGVGSGAFPMDICNGSFQSGDSRLFRRSHLQAVCLCHLAHASCRGSSCP